MIIDDFKTCQFNTVRNRNQMMTLEPGLIKDLALPLFSALLVLLRAPARMFMHHYGCIERWQKELFSFFLSERKLLHLQVFNQRTTHKVPLGNIPNTRRTQNTTVYVLTYFLKFFFFFFLKRGGGREWNFYDISIICFSDTVARSRKILPSFEPTVLK